MASFRSIFLLCSYMLVWRNLSMTTDQNTSKMQFSKVFNLDKIPLALAVSSWFSVNCSETILVFSYPQLSAFKAEWAAHLVSLRCLTTGRPPRSLTKVPTDELMHWKSSRCSLPIQRSLKQQKYCPQQNGWPGWGNVTSKRILFSN